MTLVNSFPPIIYKGNAAGVAQVKKEYIKRDKTKHISSKFFILMNSKKVDKLMLNKFATQITL